MQSTMSAQQQTLKRTREDDVVVQPASERGKKLYMPNDFDKVSTVITDELKKAMSENIIGKLSSLLNIKNLKKFKKRLDPRLYNGAIFIGLDSPVIKSHGGTDYIGFSNSLSVCSKIIKGNLIEKIKKNIN